MSKGASGLFSGTRGDLAAAGSAVLMQPDQSFLKNIARRKDVDANGYYDVIAHGTPDSIELFHNGQVLLVSHRVLANLLKRDEHYRGEGVRLLSCNTGSSAGQFAQNLANKLGVPVKAPTELLWAWPDGSYAVARGRNGLTNSPDPKRPGRFKTFYPRRRAQ